MKKLSFLLAILMLVTLFAAPISAVGEDKAMLYTMADIESGKVTTNVFLGTATKGYKNSLLAGYVIGTEYDTSAWEAFENSTFNAVRLIGAADQEAWAVDPDAFSGFEVDLGAASDIGGFIFHYSQDWWNNTEKWLAIHDINVYVSTDGTNWTNVAKVKDLPIEKATLAEKIDASAYVTGGKASAGTLVKDETFGPENLVVGSDHPYVDVTFDKAVKARYVRVAVLSTYHKNLENNNKIDSPSFAQGLELYKPTAAQTSSSSTPAASTGSTAPKTADLTLVAPIMAAVASFGAAVIGKKRNH